jgi:Cu+-exporting ATPase
MTKTFIVEGMTCAACSSAVERVLNRSEHVTLANVNLTTKKLVIEYDDTQFSIEDIVSKIEKAGFTAFEDIVLKTITLPIEGMT